MRTSEDVMARSVASFPSRCSGFANSFVHPSVQLVTPVPARSSVRMGNIKKIFAVVVEWLFVSQKFSVDAFMVIALQGHDQGKEMK
jgi:hypothetical protein